MEKDVDADLRKGGDISWASVFAMFPRRISVPTPIISAVYAIF
jgi:hypothetical protein